MQRTPSMLALLLAAAMSAGPAWSAPPEGKGNGKGSDKAEKHERKKAPEDRAGARARAGEVGQGERMGRKPLQPGAYFNTRSRDAVHKYYASAGKGGKACPPGLAKKDNGCLPPGQAKKWQIGEPLPGDVEWVAPPRQIVVALPPLPPGHRYVQVAGDILLIAIGSKMVVDGIEGLAGR